MPNVSERKLEYVISAVDNASSVYKKVGKQAAFMGTAIVGAFGFAVKAAIDAQAQMAKVDTILNTMGKSGKNMRDGLLAAADAATKLGFDDEEAAESLARLAQRTGDLEQATKLNNIAMDLARNKSIGLSDASNLVGMVMSGNSRVLKQYGIDIKETASPLEALDELQKKLAGSAANYADTFSGKMDVFKVQMGNMAETIGGAILPVLVDLLKHIEPIILKTAEWINQHPELVKQMAFVALGLTALALALSPTGMIMTALIAIGAAVVMVSTQWEALSQVLTDDTLPAFEGVLGVIQRVSKVLRDMVGEAKAAWSAVQKFTGGDFAISLGQKLRTTIGKQTGGPAAGVVRVGERGPETVILPMGSHVLPAGATARGGGGGGGGVKINVTAPIIGTVYVTNQADEGRIAAKVEQAITRMIQLQELRAA